MSELMEVILSPVTTEKLQGVIKAILLDASTGLTIELQGKTENVEESDILSGKFKNILNNVINGYPLLIKMPYLKIGHTCIPEAILFVYSNGEDIFQIELNFECLPVLESDTLLNETINEYFSAIASKYGVKRISYGYEPAEDADTNIFTKHL